MPIDNDQITEPQELTEEERALLDEFLEDVKTDAELVEEQQEQAAEDLRFIETADGMWRDWNETQFQNRTLLQLDLVSPYVARYIAEWNLNRVGVQFQPDDDQTTDDDAELMDGIWRADFRDNSGKEAIDNAVDEAAKCGIGHFKLGTVFEDDEDPENDNQRIDFRPLHESFQNVYWDAGAKRINKSDASRCTVLTGFAKKGFEKKYPNLSATSAFTPHSAEHINSLNATTNEVYVATRYEIKRIKQKVHVYNDIVSEKTVAYTDEDHKDIKDELSRDQTKIFKRERVMERRIVIKSVFTGDTFIEKPRRIAGKFIPIIPVYAYRSYVEGAEWYRGLVRKLKDAQRMFNMIVSKLAEVSASSGDGGIIVDPEQIKGFEKFYEDPTNNSYFPLRALRDGDGKPIVTGPLGFMPVPKMDENTQAILQIVLEVIKEITGGNPQEAINPETSGKALNAILKRVSMNTQEAQDNAANAIEWSGKVYQPMAEEVYTESRMVRTVGKDGNFGRKQINTTVLDEETGKIVEGQSVAGKKFRVYSDIGPQFETQREERIEQRKGLAEMLKGTGMESRYYPPLVASIIMDSPGDSDDPLKKVARQDMLALGLVKPETDEEKQLVAQLQQPQPDPQQKLIEAASEQQLAEARNLDAESIKDIADAEKKAAETRKIASETEQGKARTLPEIRKEILERTGALPINDRNVA